MKLAVAIGSLLLAAGSSATAGAAPPAAGGSAKAEVGTSGASSSASGSGGREWPDFVYGGNAIGAALPVQVAFVGYEPRVRFGVSYERQLYKRHWVHLGFAGLLDRGDHHTFGERPCERQEVDGDRICKPGTVAGLDAWLGYTHKFHVEEHPWVVPLVRAGVGGGYWRYPRLNQTLNQDIERSWTLGARLGGGVRIFPTRDFGVGLDLDFQVGFLRDRSEPIDADASWDTRFLFGLAVLPAVEYRF
jgi:hypothetical protein